MKRNRTKNYVETTIQMKEAIEEAMSFVPEKERKEAVKKSCQRCFQALRIDVNSEFEVLYDFLESCRMRPDQVEELPYLRSIPERTGL